MSQNKENKFAQDKKHCPVVAIGASAGGLRALQEFFRNAPVDSGICFVVITHVRSDRESLLPEILSNTTEIPIVSSEEGMLVEPNKVIIAKDNLLSIEDGAFYSTKKEKDDPNAHHPVDYFFRKLASDQRQLAIGVILSGTGNDGTVGMKAIKEAGGAAMVQEPESAEYSGMPESAIKTGIVDFILEPSEMPRVLVNFCGRIHPKAGNSKKESERSEDIIHSVLLRLKTYTGQDFTEYKRSTMSRRIIRRINVLQLKNPREYLDYLHKNPNEMDLLIQELLITVTNFFRDSEAFEALAEKAIPQLLEQRKDGEEIRVWISGCATGEEAYSVAILLDEEIKKSNRTLKVRIFASDLNEKGIEIARKGKFPEGIGADVSQERLQKYFSNEDGFYSINKRIREMIVFATQNVISDPPFIDLDLLVCRNLLIYLNEKAQQRLLNNFHYALRPGGVLFIGSSESLGDCSHLFDTIDSKNKLMRRKEGSSVIHSVMLPSREKEHRVDFPSAAEKFKTSANGKFIRAVEQSLLKNLIPCCIIANANHRVLYLQGRSGEYLEPEQGQPKYNLIQMAREGLRSPLSLCFDKVAKGEDEVSRDNVRVRTNGDSTNVDIKIKKLKSPEMLKGLFLIILSPSPLQGGNPPEAPEQDVSAEEMSVRHQLEQELHETRENLQATIEELETANEELMSSNEELQSTNEEFRSSNEELETSREEMQSLNEELNTVNAQLEAKMEDLSRSKDDINNLLNSLQVATIFLDKALKVKRYTKRAREVVNLIESDIGRPLSDLTSLLSYEDLIDDCREVLSTLITKEKEVKDESDRWHLVRVVPYRTAEDKIDGVVVIIVNIDRTKKAEIKALAGLAFFESIVETVREPILILDEDLRIVSSNESFCREFSSEAKSIEGMNIFEINSKTWDVPDLRKLLEDVLPANSAINDYRIEEDFKGTGHRVFLLNARRLQQEPEIPQMILLTFKDVTEKGL